MGWTWRLSCGPGGGTLRLSCGLGGGPGGCLVDLEVVLWTWGGPGGCLVDVGVGPEGNHVGVEVDLEVVMYGWGWAWRLSWVGRPGG